jgi:hypothetical protein
MKKAAKEELNLLILQIIAELRRTGLFQAFWTNKSGEFIAAKGKAQWRIVVKKVK